MKKKIVIVVIFCIRDGYEIPKDDLKFARQEDGSYLCSFCRAEKEKIEKE